jgi:hypothetical protein
MVTQRKLTAAEQRLFDQILIERYPHCLKEISQRGLEGCARWAVEQSAVLIEARRQFLNERQS